MPPSLTVIVVSDYEAGEKTWADEVVMARALAAQDLGAPFDVVFAESAENRGVAPPADIFDALPHAQVVFHGSARSAGLKDHAVAACDSEWVAVFEADAPPEPGWLRLTLEAARKNPHCDVISGRTWHGDETAWRRAINLLARSFDDMGRSQESRHVSNNAALYRTSVLRRFPYPDDGTAFSSAVVRNRAMRQAGVRFYSCREALSRHAIGGPGFVWDVHRNLGYADMTLAGRRGHYMIPILIFKRLRNQVASAMRVGADYLRPQDWPLWALLLVATRVPDIRGMHEALRAPEALRNSAYR